MKPRLRTILIAAVSLLAAFGAFIVLTLAGVFDVDIWERESPLPNRISVTSVQDGTVTLSDGRTCRPAGVRRRDNVPVGDYDDALRVIVAQGVVVIRDLGDGTAFLLAEPKYYNWCGTRCGYKGNPWARWAGSYLQRPLSELLIFSAYAKPDLEQTALTARERWRLEGVERFVCEGAQPVRISQDLVALKYDENVNTFDDFDATLERLWKPAPSP